jgi:hypothetical protein
MGRISQLKMTYYFELRTDLNVISRKYFRNMMDDGMLCAYGVAFQEFHKTGFALKKFY